MNKLPELKELPTQELVDRLTADFVRQLDELSQSNYEYTYKNMALTDERDALAAQVEQLQKLMTVWKDPAARDAEVAAKAYINALLTHTDEPESWCSSQADNYVSQLRQAAKGGE
jgi:uncharacterized protein YjbK